MKFTETIRRHPKAAAAATAVVLGIGALEAVGWAQNPTHEVPAGACLSPIAASGTYIAPGAHLLLQTDTGLFTTGVIARGTLPKGAYGLEASFKAPDAAATAWEANASRMLKADAAGRFTLKMAVGPGKVQFGVRIAAPAGSPLCASAPPVEYMAERPGGYFGASGDLPWPNPVSVVVNVF